MIDREIRNIEMLGVSNIGGIRGYLQTQGNGNGIVQQVQAGLSVSKSGITPLSTNFYSSSKFSSDEETSEFIVKYLLSKGVKILNVETSRALGLKSNYLIANINQRVKVHKQPKKKLKF